MKKTHILLIISILAIFIPSCKKNCQKKYEVATQTTHSDTTQKKLKNQIQKFIFDFENYQTNQKPDSWSEFYNGKGTTKWQIVEDNGNKVLAQLASKNPNNHFNIIVYDSIEFENGQISVKIKSISGHYDQGGGIIWRFQDKNNYYVVRYNPLEDNVVAYKVEKGIRTDLPLVDEGKTYGKKVDKPQTEFVSLKIIVNENRFDVFFNNTFLYTVKDSTFTKGGKIGLWTKADAVSYFDNLKIIKTD